VNIEEQKQYASSYISTSTTSLLSLIDYRGVECYTVARKRYKLLSNRCVAYAQRHGMDDIETAELYSRCNTWSRKVSLVQAIQDYIEIYYLPKNEHMTPRNTSLKELPPIWSMVPPSEVPSTLKRKEQPTACTTTDHEDEAESVCTRRVRRRVSI